MRTVNFLSGALVKLNMRRFKQSFTCSGSKLSRPSRSSTGPNDARDDAHQADSGKAGLDKGPVLRTPPSLVEISSSSSDKSDKKKDNSTMTRLMSSTEEVTSQGCPVLTTSARWHPCALPLPMIWMKRYSWLSKSTTPRLSIFQWTALLSRWAKDRLVTQLRWTSEEANERRRTELPSHELAEEWSSLTYRASWGLLSPLTYVVHLWILLLFSQNCSTNVK